MLDRKGVSLCGNWKGEEIVGAYLQKYNFNVANFPQSETKVYERNDLALSIQHSLNCKHEIREKTTLKAF